MKTYDTMKWNELGIVVDDENGVAALVGISVGDSRPMPSVQLGRIIGPERRFSPFLHPVVDWKGGAGSIASPELIGSVTPELQRKIADFLAPHLIERPDLESAVSTHEIIDINKQVRGETVLRCLSCS
jgi:hypothetical protein